MNNPQTARAATTVIPTQVGIQFDKLPEGWKLKPLGEIVEPTRPRISPSEKPDLPFLGMDHIEAHTMRMLGSVPAGTMRSSAVHFQPGDVLYGRLRPYLNKVFQPNFEGMCSAEFIVFPETKELDNKYLQYFLNSSKFVRHATSLNSGDRPRVKFEQLAPNQIPLPPTVDQQKRIVAKIEELFSHLDAGIEALKKTKQLLKQYRQSVLKAAVTGELTMEWREANKDKFEPASQLLEKIEDARNAWIEEQIEEGSNEAKRLRNKLKKYVIYELDVSLIPEGWGSVSLTMLCLLVVDCHNKTAPYVESGIPLIRTSNIRNGVINFEEKMKYVNQETYEYWSRRCQPEPGDILFTREAPMGESAIIPENKKVCMGQRMMLLRVIHDLVDVNYLHIALMDPLFLKRIQGFKVGVGVQHLRVGDVEKAVIALPSLAEQKEIVRVANERLDSTTRLEYEIDHQLVKTEKNKQSILASAFSGKIDRDMI